ncbi:hypothetical protein J4410_00060 [Candidatus Woesearchaeota archaeon]|nr:hypothetical protein [Candidatus Woesearchaeota archaeon]
MEEQPYKREPAYRTNVELLLSSSFIKGEGFTTTLAQFPQGIRAGRVQLVGMIVSKEDNSFIVDDGSGSIVLRNMDKPGFFQRVEVGDLVLVIGKPRVYEDEKYLYGEVCKKIENHLWRDVHVQWVTKEKKELKKNGTSNHKEEKILDKKDDEGMEKLSSAKKVYDLVKTLDQGTGTTYEELLSQSSMQNTEQIIKQLLEEGVLFEIQPGKLKVLD